MYQKRAYKKKAKVVENNIATTLAVDKLINKDDLVNHLSHYIDGKIEAIDFIEDKKLDFHLGNAVKYIARAGKKNPTEYKQDLEKARWYLDRKISQL